MTKVGKKNPRDMRNQLYEIPKGVYADQCGAQLKYRIELYCIPNLFLLHDLNSAYIVSQTYVKNELTTKPMVRLFDSVQNLPKEMLQTPMPSPTNTKDILKTTTKF